MSPRTLQNGKKKKKEKEIKFKNKDSVQSLALNW
jgi:hypothetical protein